MAPNVFMLHPVQDFFMMILGFREHTRSLWHGEMNLRFAGLASEYEDCVLEIIMTHEVARRRANYPRRSDQT